MVSVVQIGPLRVALIYLASGMGGALASGVFLPYNAEAQPPPLMLAYTVYFVARRALHFQLF